MTIIVEPAVGMPDGLDPDVGAVLVELNGSVEVVRSNRSRATMFAIAGFTGLTCLGLAGTTLFPRLTDRASERRDVAAARASYGVQAAGAAPVAVSAEPPGDAPASAAWSAASSPVVATWRLLGDIGHRQLFVSGAASPQVERIAVQVAVGGRTVASADVLPVAADRGRDDVVPWSVVLDLPNGRDGRDAVATVAVSWTGRVAIAGTLAAAVVLGDGRRASGGR
jgi:hypothetical protein